MFGEGGAGDNCSGGLVIGQTQPDALTLAVKVETCALPPARRSATETLTLSDS